MGKAVGCSILRDLKFDVLGAWRDCHVRYDWVNQRMENIRSCGASWWSNICNVSGCQVGCSVVVIFFLVYMIKYSVLGCSD